MQTFFQLAYRSRSHLRLPRAGLIFLGIVAMVLSVQTPVQAGTVIWSPGSTLQSVDAGSKATCAVAGNKAYCWGENHYGTLGTTTVAVNGTAYYPVPVDTTGALASKSVTKVSMGALGYACAVADGKPYCWGRNTYGMFGDGSRNDSTTPVSTIATGAINNKTVTDISTGHGHTCAVADARAYCWGTGGNGRIGDNASSSRLEPTAVYTGGVLGNKTVTSIAADSASGCAVADGKVYCWGSNNHGQLGNGTLVDSNQPVLAGAGSAMNSETMVKVDGGNGNFCAHSANGKVFCWGQNYGGQLGNGTKVDSSSPVRALGSLSGKTAVDISTGQSRPCALDSVSTPHCWGNGVLGDGGYQESTVPVSVITTGALSGVSLARITAGDERVSCVQSSNGVTYCWGVRGTMLGTGFDGARFEPDYVRTINEPLSTSAYRFYKNTNSLTPGAPLAATNTAATLTLAGETFRLRADVHAGTHGIAPGDNEFRLQYAQKTATTCSAQASGFVNVTGGTPIGFNLNPDVQQGDSMTTHSNDPISASVAAPQIYHENVSNFTNTRVINPNKKGLWDFSLRAQNNAPTNTSFCLRIAYADGTPLESSTRFPEIRTANPELRVSIVNASGTSVANPNYTLSNALVRSSCQTTTGAIGTSAQRIRVYNSLSSTGWSLSIAPTAGATASWQRNGGGASYDFNDGSGSPPGCNSGSDGDSIAGQLTINPSPATVTAQSGCNATGINKGPPSAFSHGSTNAITLVSGSSSTPLGCYFDITNVGMIQRIPSFQPSGLYNMNMTITVVAQ